MKQPGQNLNDALGDLLTGQVCIVGVGNRSQGDDGAGPRLIDQRQPEAAGIWIDAGAAPENYLEPIARTSPDLVLIVDALGFGGFPGECQLMDANLTDSSFVSTHAGSLKMLAQYLSARTGAQIRVLGIQPQRIEFGKGLSGPVARSVRDLASILSDLLSRQSI